MDGEEKEHLADGRRTFDLQWLDAYDMRFSEHCI